MNIGLYLNLLKKFITDLIELKFVLMHSVLFFEHLILDKPAKSYKMSNFIFNNKIF